MVMVHDTLQNLQAKLPVNAFVRVHKSYVISMIKINYIDGNTITIADKEIPLGQKYKNDFLKSLG
jgi:DNA-binding LytR/AlgR family response regulator